MSKALVPARVPPLVLARTPEAERRTDAVELTSTGALKGGRLRVWLDEHRRPLQVAEWGAWAATVVAVGVFLGPMPVVCGLLSGAVGQWFMRGQRRLARGMRLMLHDRLDEAEAVLRPILAGRGIGEPARASAALLLVQIEVARGRPLEALHLVLRHFAGKVLGPTNVQARLLEAEILVNLDKLDDARRTFELLALVQPTGEYLRVRYWTTELYLALAGVYPPPPREILDARADVAGAYACGAPILGLLAWGYQQLDDPERADALLALARTRASRLPLAPAYPRLHAWMEAQPYAPSRDPRGGPRP